MCVCMYFLHFFCCFLLDHKGIFTAEVRYYITGYRLSTEWCYKPAEFLCFGLYLGISNFPPIVKLLLRSVSDPRATVKCMILISIFWLAINVLLSVVVTSDNRNLGRNSLYVNSLKERQELRDKKGKIQYLKIQLHSNTIIRLCKLETRSNLKGMFSH